MQKTGIGFINRFMVAPLIMGILTVFCFAEKEEPAFRYPMTVEKVTDLTQPHIKASRQNCIRTSRRSAKLRSLPSDVNEKELCFFFFELGLEKTVMAMHRSEPKIWVDFDCDQSLAGEKAIEGLQYGSDPHEDAQQITCVEGDIYLYGPIYLKLWQIDKAKSEAGDSADSTDTADANDKNDEPKWQGVWFYIESRPRRTPRLYPAVQTTGEAGIRYDTFKIAIVDKNYDGVFGNESVSEVLGYDIIAVDLNKDGKFYGKKEILELKERVWIDKHWFAIQTAFDGSGMNIAERLTRARQWAIQSNINATPAAAQMRLMGFSGCRSGG